MNRRQRAGRWTKPHACLLAISRRIINRQSTVPRKGDRSSKTYHVQRATDHVKEPEKKVEEPIPIGTERILFIDDEEAVIDLSKQMLEQLGYKVETRTSSVEALELFNAKPDRFDLVITDMTMPNKTGDQLAKEMMKIRPDIPIILCTGFSERIDEMRSKAIGIKAYVMKPLMMRVIAQTIREVLDKD